MCLWVVSVSRTPVSANVGQRLTSSISYSPASFAQLQKGHSTALSSAIFVGACYRFFVWTWCLGCQGRRVPSEPRSLLHHQRSCSRVISSRTSRSLCERSISLRIGIREG